MLTRLLYSICWGVVAMFGTATVLVVGLLAYGAPLKQALFAADGSNPGLWLIGAAVAVTVFMGEV